MYPLRHVWFSESGTITLGGSLGSHLFKINPKLMKAATHTCPETLFRAYPVHMENHTVKSLGEAMEVIGCWVGVIAS